MSAMGCRPPVTDGSWKWDGRFLLETVEQRGPISSAAASIAAPEGGLDAQRLPLAAMTSFGSKSLRPRGGPVQIVRNALLAAFLASLVVATTWHDTAIGAYVRYAPPVFLVLGLAVLLIEWLRKRSA